LGCSGCEGATMVGTKELVGTQGWLRFLIISLVFLSPAAGFVMTFGQISGTEDQYPTLLTSDLWVQKKRVVWAFFALQAAVGIYAGYRLNSRFEPATVPIAIACLWLAGPVLNYLVALVIGALDGNSIVGTPEVASTIVRSAIPATVWTAYLLRSRRVKNTYRLALNGR
jgi:Protein of unknown function (DUF2569)